MNDYDQFTQEAIYRLDQSNAILGTYASLLAVDFPNLYNLTPSPTEVMDVIHQEAAGNFPALEQFIITSWQLTPFEVGIIQGTFARITESDVNQVVPISVGQALTRIAAERIPEPPTFWLFGSTLALWIGYSLCHRRYWRFLRNKPYREIEGSY